MLQNDFSSSLIIPEGQRRLGNCVKAGACVRGVSSASASARRVLFSSLARVLSSAKNPPRHPTVPYKPLTLFLKSPYCEPSLIPFRNYLLTELIAFSLFQ